MTAPSRTSRLLALLLPGFLLMLTAVGCLQKGDMRFNPLPTEETYTLGGRILLPEVVESDLMLVSVREPLAVIGAVSDFSKFVVSAGGLSAQVKADGTFRLPSVRFTNDLVLSIAYGKVMLRKRLYPRNLRQTDVTKLEVSLDSTVRALAWEAAHAQGIEISEADIAAREYAPLVASAVTALRLALQLPKKSVPKTVLDLDMVIRPVRTLATAVEPREDLLTESLSVVQNAVLNRNADLLAHYLSPDFSNDWDTQAGFHDFMSEMDWLFGTYIVHTASYTVHQMEFLPGSQARIRISYGLGLEQAFSAERLLSPVYTADMLWRKEGDFWKILRNAPYKKTDPTQVGADARWGEIARAHAALQETMYRENIATLGSHISDNFGNDWDIYSTKSDLLESANRRFLACDVKIATYTIRSIDFIGTDLARVHVTARVRVIKLALGIDLDWGTINAVIDWRREAGGWKIFRNLPYKFSHPRDLL